MHTEILRIACCGASWASTGTHTPVNEWRYGMTFQENIQLATLAGARGIWITTFEEVRVREELLVLADRLGQLTFTWSSGSGLQSRDTVILPPAAKLMEPYSTCRILSREDG